MKKNKKEKETQKKRTNKGLIFLVGSLFYENLKDIAKAMKEAYDYFKNKRNEKTNNR